MNELAQIVIGCIGPVGIWLSQDTRPAWRRYACIVGLLVQPFWIYATYAAEQWGMFGVTFLYTAAWAKGFYHQWVKRS